MMILTDESPFEDFLVFKGNDSFSSFNSEYCTAGNKLTEMNKTIVHHTVYCIYITKENRVCIIPVVKVRNVYTAAIYCQTYFCCIAFKFHCINDPKNKAYPINMSFLPTAASETEAYIYKHKIMKIHIPVSTYIRTVFTC